MTPADAGAATSRRPPRPPRPWRVLWSNETGSDVSMGDFLDTLPTYSRQRNDPVRCRLNHNDHDDADKLLVKHKVRRILTRCRSARCQDSGVVCKCIYRLLICEPSGLATIAVDGEHTMTNPNISSPKPIRLTDAMKQWLAERLEEDASNSPVDLFGLLAKKIDTGVIQGPKPTVPQVQNFVKKWRSLNKKDVMQPVIDLCEARMYGVVANIAESTDELLIMCDTTREGATLTPKLGTGTPTSPFRIGLTCFTLLDQYVNIQRDPRCTTLFHVDSTHSIVKMKYPVFVFGISDCCGKFFPIVYFCTSQRTGTDIEWCCAFLKRVIWETFMVQFSPQFVMTDADNAQFNACVAQLPHSKILMCWFHVCQNVKTRIEKAALAPVTIAMIWRDLNNLHYSRTEEEFLLRRSRVLAAWASASDSCPPFKVVADHIIAQWILHPRFSCWQAYHTPPGCATTNNPLEQYHKTLKLVNKSKRATPTEMIDRLDRSRLVFVHMHKTFSSTHSVSERLKALYNLTVRRKELRAAPLPSAGDLPVHLVQVRHRPRTSYADKESEQADDFYVEDPKKSQMPYKSIHVLKMQWQDMPRDGWLVDARLRSCSCRFNMKFGVCIHVIHATRELSLHCPGIPAPVPVFVSNRRQTGTTTQSTQRIVPRRQVDGNSHQESSEVRICSADTNGDPAAHYPVQGPQLRPPSDNTSHHLGTFHGLPVLGPQPRSPPPVFVDHHIDTESGIREDLESTTAPANMELFRLAPIEAEIGSYEAMLLRECEMRSESLSEIRTVYQGADGYQRSYSDSVLHTTNIASNYGAAPMTRASSARAPHQVTTINPETASPESFDSIRSSRQSCEQTKRRRC